MSSEASPLFGGNTFLEELVENFLDKISEGMFVVEAGVGAYLSTTNDPELCQQKLNEMIAIKQRCSELRHTIVTMLYTEMLLPDARGDVLRLLGNLFELLDEIGDDYQEMMIVQPLGLEGFADDFAELNAMATRCSQAAVLAARTFFRNPAAVRDHINDVRMSEDETDRIALRIKRKAFAVDLSFEQRTQVREATAMLDGLADKAENISDDLSIYAIKCAR